MNVIESKKAVKTKENIEIGWFIRFSTTTQVLHDLGRDFINYLILLKMSTFWCLEKTTALYPFFSNAEVERRDEIINALLTKLRNEKFWGLEATIGQTLFTKNSRLDVNGLFPDQRVCESNPKKEKSNKKMPAPPI